MTKPTHSVGFVTETAIIASRAQLSRPARRVRGDASRGNRTGAFGTQLGTLRRAAYQAADDIRDAPLHDPVAMALVAMALVAAPHSRLAQGLPDTAALAKRCPEQGSVTGCSGRHVKGLGAVAGKVWTATPEATGSPQTCVTINVAAIRITPGTCLLLYTDGLIERRGQILDEGLDHLTATALCSEPPTTLLDGLLAHALPEAGPADDIALIAVRYLPAPLHQRLPADLAHLSGLRRAVRCPPR